MMYEAETPEGVSYRICPESNTGQIWNSIKVKPRPYLTSEAKQAGGGNTDSLFLLVASIKDNQTPNYIITSYATS